MKLLGYILLLLGGLSITAYAQNLEPKTIHQIELNLSENVLNGKVIFKAQKTIKSSQVIGEKAEVIQQAQSSITLAEGFHAQEGSIFLASIESENPSLEDISMEESIFEEHQQNIAIYPNPSDGRFTIDLPILEKNASGRVEIINPQGTQVFSSSIAQKRNLTIDLSNQSSGVYIIRIQTSNQKFITKKIVIE